jgi:hypothetical protein
MEKILFEVATPLDFYVRVTQNYWNIIVSIKHPVMSGRETEVKLTLTDPDEIRQSVNDESVYLFYKMQKQKRWICAVAKNNSGYGFLITAYPTDKIKEGIQIWKK